MDFHKNYPNGDGPYTLNDLKKIGDDDFVDEEKEEKKDA